MKNNFEFPQEMRRSDMPNFVLVTEHNRKDMVKLGRIYYVILDEKTPKLHGRFCIYPCLRPGSTLIVSGDTSKPNQDYSVQCGSGEEFSSWKESYDSVITHLIKKKKLFVNKKDKLVRFSWK